MKNQTPKEGIKNTLFVFTIHFKILCSANPEPQKILFAPVCHLIFFFSLQNIPYLVSPKENGGRIISKYHFSHAANSQQFFN